MANLTYDFPQNRKVAHLLEAYNRKRNQMIGLNPTELPIRDTYHQGLVGGGLVPSGNSPSYPPYDMDVQGVMSYHPRRQYVNSFSMEQVEPKTGGKAGRNFLKKLLKSAEPVLEIASKKAVEKLSGMGRKPRKGGSELGAYKGGAGSGGAYSGGRSKSARGALVSKLMKEKGMTLPQASKYIKEKGL